MYNLSVIYDEVTYECMTRNGSCDLFCRIMATSKNCTWKEYILPGGIKKCIVRQLFTIVRNGGYKTNGGNLGGNQSRKIIEGSCKCVLACTESGLKTLPNCTENNNAVNFCFLSLVIFLPAYLYPHLLLFLHSSSIKQRQ